MLPNNWYDFLKWFAIAGLNALGLAYGKLAQVWGLPYGTEITETLDVIGVLLAAFLMWKNYQYKKEFDIYTAPKAQPDATPITLDYEDEETAEEGE